MAVGVIDVVGQEKAGSSAFVVQLLEHVPHRSNCLVSGGVQPESGDKYSKVDFRVLRAVTVALRRFGQEEEEEEDSAEVNPQIDEFEKQCVIGSCVSPAERAGKVHLFVYLMVGVLFVVVVVVFNVPSP